MQVATVVQGNTVINNFNQNVASWVVRTNIAKTSFSGNSRLENKNAMMSQNPNL